MYVFMCTYVYVGMYLCMYMCAHMHMCVYVCAYVRVYMHGAKWQWMLKTVFFLWRSQKALSHLYYTHNLCLTLSVRTEYIYSVASDASRPDRVLILRDIYKVVK
jgi:hypothetical protein